MRRTLGQIRAILLDEASPSDNIVSSRMKAGVYLARLGVRIIKQWARDRCPQQAAALTFQSALSLVPILAIAFTVLRSAGMLDTESQLVDFIAQQIFPDLPDFARHLEAFSAKISAGAAGSIGLGFTFVTCYSLYSSVGKIFNDIWRVSARRSIVYRLLTFYALVTLMPVLAGVYLYWSGKLIGSDTYARLLAPLAVQFVALFLTNKLIPTTVVRWHAALAGAFVSGILLEGLKWGFVTFAKKAMLTSYGGIYGPVALVPLVLSWIYISWLLILLGAEVANAIQNLRRLEAEDRRRRGEEPLNGAVAAQVLVAVASDFRRGGKGLSREALAEDFGLSPETIDRLADRLRRRGFLAEVQGDRQGFVLGRPAETISITDLLAAFRSSDLETAEGASAPELTRLIRELEETRHARVSGVTIADLLPRDDAETADKIMVLPVSTA